MFKKILVGYDGSKGARAALEHAAVMAREYGAELHAVWVREPLPRHSDLPGEFEGEQEAADDYFEERAREIEVVAHSMFTDSMEGFVMTKSCAASFVRTTSTSPMASSSAERKWTSPSSRSATPSGSGSTDCPTWRRSTAAGCRCSRTSAPVIELRHGERFRQIVVRAEIQSFDALVHIAAGREQQDGDRISVAAELAQNAQPVAAGQDDIEHDPIEILRRDPAQGLVAMVTEFGGNAQDGSAS